MNPFLSNFEHFDFLAFFDPLDQDERNTLTYNYSLNIFRELKNIRKKEMIVKEHSRVLHYVY
jgi:hypothetical protein